MTKTDKKKFKFIASLVIILIFLSSSIFLAGPKEVFAQGAPVGDTTTEVSTGLTAVSTGASAATNTTSLALHIKQVATDVLKEVAKGVARKALAEMTKETVNWINTGRSGRPLFLTNTNSFFKDIGKSEIKDFVDQIGYDNLKFPFGKDYALNVIASYKRQFADNAQYSLSNAIKDPNYLNAYRNNFNVGGWNGFLLNTQYPQNNYLGFQITATQKLGQQLAGTVQNTAQTVQTALQQGQGFLSPQTCPSNPSYNNIANNFVKPSFNDSDYAKQHPFTPKYICTYGPKDGGADMMAGSGVSPDGNDQPDDVENPNSNCALYQKEQDDWKFDELSAKGTWEQSNTCPGGLQNTTPGSVVAASITKALGVSQDQASLGAAFGNSLSAIFDALINHYMDKGLTALATKINPKPKDSPTNSDYCYMGECLGSSDDTSLDAWDTGPDEAIVLSQFKKDVDSAVINTQAELNIISNDTPGRPGLLQMLSLIWPKIRELDMCQPGPDLGWEDRLDEEMGRNSIKLQGKANDSDGDTAAQAKVTYNALKFAVDFYKDWVKNQMLTALPDSVDYIDATKSVDDLSQQGTELINKNRLKIGALARMKAIKISLDKISIQPATGSAQEKVMVNLKKQFDAAETSISNTSSIEDSRNSLNVLLEKYATLNSQVAQCNAERTAKGWGSSVAPTGTPTPTSIPPENGTGNNISNPPPIAEDLSNVTFSSDIAEDVASWPATINLSVTLGSDTVNYSYDKMDKFTTVGSDASVGNGWIFVYKNGWQATTVNQFRANHGNDNKSITDEIMCGGIGGTNTFNGTFHPKVGEQYGFMVSGVARAGASPASDDEKVRSNVVMVNWTVPLAPVSCETSDDTPAPSGPEQTYFCDAALVGGYHHDSFITPNYSGSSSSTNAGGLFGGLLGAAAGGLLNHTGPAGSVTYPEIPLVNAQDVFHYRSFLNLIGHTVNIELKCNLIYKSTVLDYKGDLPGLTTVAEPPRGIDPDASGTCDAPADDAKHPDPGIGAAIESARNELAAAGMKWIAPTDETAPDFQEKNQIYECNRFEMLKRAVKILEAGGSDAGLYSKTAGNNCEGYAVDIVAFPDGYLYDAIGGGDNPNSSWGVASCNPLKPENYQKASNVANTNYPPN